jgi:hypothetical protein
VGDIFSADVGLRELIDRTLREHRIAAADLLADVEDDAPDAVVNERFPRQRGAAMPPCLIAALPPLPDPLQYRFLDRDLVLVDVDASLVVDLLPGVLPEFRQTPATGQVMRDKLVHSEKILEAIMTSDFALLQRESAQLARATTAPAWAVLLTPEYRRYSVEFTRVTDALIDAAERRDLDAAAMHYVSLTLSCYQCHRYLKGARIVR